MDRRPRQSRPRRPGRRRQKLARLRHRPQSLPQTIAPSSIIAGRSFAATSCSPEATGDIRASSKPWAAPISSSSTTSASSPSTATSARNPRRAVWTRSTIVTSQLPLSAWHEVIGDPTYADAIVDRLAQCASHRTHRREPAPRPRQKFENGWTCNPTVGTKSLGQQARRPRAGSSRFRERLRRNRHLCWGSRALGAVFLVRDRAVRPCLKGVISNPGLAAVWSEGRPFNSPCRCPRHKQAQAEWSLLPPRRRS
jgi:hypothetical protein